MSSRQRRALEGDLLSEFLPQENGANSRGNCKSRGSSLESEGLPNPTMFLLPAG